jgi:hypothetical protein
MQQMFLLQILLLAQHVSGAPLCPSSGAREYYTVGCRLWSLVFKLSVWCGAEGCVSDLRAAAYRQLENQAPKTTGGNQLYNTLELLMMGIIVPRNMLSKQ